MLIWRLRMHRIRHAAEKVLRFARTAGIIGVALIALGGVIADPLGLPNPFTMTWSMILGGVFLFMAGAGFALSGEAPTVREYAEGKTEEMPGIAKLLQGLLAAAGGMLLFVVGFQQLIG
jgi:hypothetical protein